MSTTATLEVRKAPTQNPLHILRSHSGAKLHLRYGRTDGRADILSVRPSVRLLDGVWHILR